MPADFMMCVKKGGKVRTLKLPKNKYMHVCTMNGKTYHGEVKEKEMPMKKGDMNKKMQ